MIKIAVPTLTNHSKNLNDFVDSTSSVKLSSIIIIGQYMIRNFAFMYHMESLNSANITLPYIYIVKQDMYLASTIAYQQISKVVDFLKGDGHDKF